MEKKLLDPFRRRVHLLSVRRGGLIGLAIGSWAACLYLLYDWFVRPGLPVLLAGVMACAGLCLGAFWGWKNRPTDKAISLSLDKRMNLEDRISSAQELSGSGTSFESLIEDSATKAVKSVNPKFAFPYRWGLHSTHAFTSFFAASILAALFMLQPWVSGPEKSRREALKSAIPEVERIIKETLEKPQVSKEAEAEAKRLAQELEKLQKQLEQNRLAPKEAEAKAIELASQLDELEKNRKKNLEQRAENLNTARESLIEAKRQEIAERNPEVNALEPDQAAQTREELRKEELMKELDRLQKKLDSNLSEAEKRKIKAEMANLQKELDQLRKLEELRQEAGALDTELKALEQQQASLEQQLQNPNLTPQQRQKLEEQLRQNQAQQEALEKQMKELAEAAKLASEIQQAMQELQQNKAFQELQQMAEEMMRRAIENGEAAQGEKGEPMSLEEMKEMLERIKELQELLKDDAAAQELLEQMKEALENGDFTMGDGGLPLLMAMGLQNMPGQGVPGGPGGEDRMLNDSGKVNTSGKNVEPGGEAKTSAVRGKPRPEGGPSRYVEIKSPSFVGKRSSVPYNEVLPRYQQRSDRAIERQQIPKKHQNRVRDYFNSIK